MSERDVELMRRWNEALNIRDIDALIALCDPSGVFISTFDEVGGATYHGHEGIRRYFADLAEAWEEFRVDPEAYFELREHTLAFSVGRGRGSHSGAEVAMPIAQVARWRDGLMVYIKAYAHREEALRDLGVSLDELEPVEP